MTRVMRTIKSRKADPGSSFAEEEVDQHRAHLKKSIDDAKVRAKAKAKAKKRSAETIPLLANVICAQGFPFLLPCTLDSGARIHTEKGAKIQCLGSDVKRPFFFT